MITLRQLAHALGGDITGGQVIAPGPGHGRRDRSLAVRPSDRAPNGFVVHAFAPGDDWRECRDYVATKLGIGPDMMARFASSADRAPPSAGRRVELAQALWCAARDPRGTVVERYLSSRGLDLPHHVAVTAIRYHPACPWRDDDLGITIKVPAIVAAMRSIATHQITAVHRTRLTNDGRKVDRRMLGVAAGSAIMLDEGEGDELVIGEGIETCLAGRRFGFGPVWAVASAGAIASFPVLRGVRKLGIFGERDQASETAVTACHSVWTASGRAVSITLPNVGKDMNDAWRLAHGI